MTIFDVHIPEKVIYPIISILVAYILILVESIIINNIINNNKTKSKHLRRSQNTVLELIKKIIKVVIILVTLISILKIFGVDTTALVTSIGAISVVIGLAFQDILKDYLVGITIILESQFALGEIVEIDGFKGEVISLGLKTTRIKALTGEVKIISNRNISQVINYSLDKTLAIIKVSVSYEDDINKVEDVLTKLSKKLEKNIDEITDKVQIDGIDELADSSVVFRLSTRARNRDIPVIKRKVYKEVKLAFDENNIKIPYPQVEVHHDK